jgi:hypothetical protein
VNSHRGYLDRAIGLAPDALRPAERPQKASFAMLGYLGASATCA